LTVTAAEQAEHNKKLILRYAMINGPGITAEDLRAFSSNEPYIQKVLAFRRSFPDYTIYVEDITAEGDFVILHGILRGTHEGEFFGLPATYRKVEYPMMVKYQVVDDMIVNAWPMFDQLELLEQLGALNRPV
jgi:predicted ester cyclase